MQVGSLFNLKAFGGEEENKQEKERQAKERKERALKREISKQMKRKEYIVTHGREMSSDDSSEEETDPTIKKEIFYEEVLKKRIFLADRFEKMERAF